MDAEDRAYPPSGGKVKMILLGIILPCVIAGFALRGWIQEEMVMPGQRGSVNLRGEAARALALCYFSIASFAHFRWFWGLLPEERVFRVGIIASMLLFLAALLWAMVCALY